MDTIHTVAVALFWVCLAGVVYVYLAYPFVLKALVRLFGRRAEAAVLTDDELPFVSLLIAAHNEESVIEERIKNSLAMDYPRQKLEIVIASDGSKDRTAEIVRRHADQGVRLLDYAVRRGKTAVLNSAMNEVRGQIILLSDANTFTEPGAARSLVRWFVDPNIGAVCGRLVLTDSRSGKNVDGAYWKYETFLKKNESRLGALLGANGAIYAIRKDLYRPIPGNTIIDDFTIPLLAKLHSGCDIVYDCDAVANEETAPDIATEFRRRARIGIGGWQAICTLWPLLSPRYGWTAFTFLSHKVLRWLCPFFLLGMLLANLVLRDIPLYRGLLLGQLAFYVAAWAGAWLPNSVPLSRWLRLAHMFVSMNMALFVGFLRWVEGTQNGTWTRTQRQCEIQAALADGGIVAPAPTAAQPRVFGPRDLAVTAGLVVATVAVFFDAWRDILRIAFRDEEFGYVLLAPMVIGWLAWARRDRLQDCTVGGGWAGILTLAAGWLVYWYGYTADPILWRAGAVLATVGAVIVGVGLKAAWRLAPAFVATIFLIPISANGRYRLAEPLQTATAQATQGIADLFGMYVNRSGNLLSINGVDVTVAEACNGMRMILTLFLVCYAVAFSMSLRLHVRLLFLAATPLVAIAANVIRLVPTIWMFGNESIAAAEKFHDISGWVMTVAAFLLLMGFCRFLNWLTQPEDDRDDILGFYRPSIA